MRNKIAKGVVFVFVIGMALFLSAGVFAAETPQLPAGVPAIPTELLNGATIEFPEGALDWNIDLPEFNIGWINDYNNGDIKWDFTHVEGIIGWTIYNHDGQIQWNYQWPTEIDKDTPTDDGTTPTTPVSTVTATTLPKTGGFVELAGAIGAIALGTGLVVFRRK